MADPPPAPAVFHPVTTRVTDTVITLDGVTLPACEGESLITALLAAGVMTGHNEFDGTARCGFCLMGACQDCTLWTAAGAKIRACTTVVRARMDLRRQPSIALAS